MITLQQKIEKLQNKIKNIRANRNNKSRIIGNILKLIRLEAESESPTKKPVKLQLKSKPATKSIERTDIHRPSLINPSDYEFVGMKVAEGGLEDNWIRNERRRIALHMSKTRGKYFSGDNAKCDICGKFHVASAVFYYSKLNEYIKVSKKCAYKLANNKDFQKAESTNPTNLTKANQLLLEAGLTEAIKIFNLLFGTDDDRIENYKRANYKNLTLVRDIVYTVIKTGKISEKQINFIKTLLTRIIEIESTQEKEEVIVPAPEGTVEVNGIILSIKTVQGDVYQSDKMLVLDDRGFKVWVSVPNSVYSGIEYDLDNLKNKRIEFIASLKQSNSPNFAYGSRPRKAKLL